MGWSAAYAITASKHAVDVATVDGHVGSSHCCRIATTENILDTRRAIIDDYNRFIIGISRISRIIMRQIAATIHPTNGIGLGSSFVIDICRIRAIDGHFHGAFGRAVQVVTAEHAATNAATVDCDCHRAEHISCYISVSFPKACQISQASAIDTALHGTLVEGDLGGRVGSGRVAVGGVHHGQSASAVYIRLNRCANLVNRH